MKYSNLIYSNKNKVILGPEFNINNIKNINERYQLSIKVLSYQLMISIK